MPPATNPTDEHYVLVRKIFAELGHEPGTEDVLAFAQALKAAEQRGAEAEREECIEAIEGFRGGVQYLSVWDAVNCIRERGLPDAT